MTTPSTPDSANLSSVVAIYMPYAYAVELIRTVQEHESLTKINRMNHIRSCNGFKHLGLPPTSKMTPEQYAYVEQECMQRFPVGTLLQPSRMRMEWVDPTRQFPDGLLPEVMAPPDQVRLDGY